MKSIKLIVYFKKLIVLLSIINNIFQKTKGYQLKLK